MAIADWSPAHRIKELEQQLRRFTMGTQEPTLAPEPKPDEAHEEAVVEAVKGIESRRRRIERLEAELATARRDIELLHLENSVLASQVAQERMERAYYHRFAIGVATSLNLVGQVCDEVMSKAQREAMAAMPFGSTSPESPLPPLDIPRFLKAGPRRDDETGGA